MGEGCIERQARIEFCVARLDTVIASEAKQSMLPRSKSELLRCFSPRNDVNSKYDSAISRRDAPELCVNCSPRKNEGAGNAGCPMHPQPRVRSLSEAHERSHHGHTGFKPGIPRAMVLTAYTVLSPASEFLLSPSLAD